MKYLYDNINNYSLSELIGGVSRSRLERAEKINNPIVKLRSLSVEFLLNRLIKQEYPDICTPVYITYDELGKPSLRDYDTIFISLSHSGDYVSCMVGSKPCGIDIEKIRADRKYEKIAKRICTDNELLRISGAEDFYSIWTLKEAALKASGFGLSYDMRLFDTSDIIIDGIKYAGAQLIAPAGYSMSYCEKLS